MTAIVYHHTDTLRLPWIIEAGELRPGPNAIGNFPDPDFLWATTCERGDRTSSISQNDYRNGVTQIVRFTLSATDFEPWPAITESFPQWTAKHIAALESAAQKRGVTDFSAWRCRVTPLSVSDVIKIEVKAYTGQWRVLDPAHSKFIRGPAGGFRAVILGGFVYGAERHKFPDGGYGFNNLFRAPHDAAITPDLKVS